MKTLFTNAHAVTAASKADYHAKPKEKRGEKGYTMSRSELMTFADCPSKWLKGYEQRTTSYMDWGNLLDCLLLTPETLKRDFAIEPETYPSEGKKDEVVHKPWTNLSNYCKKWKADMLAEGKTIVDADMLRKAGNAAGAMLMNPIVKKVVNDSEKQVWIMADYTDPKTGIVIPLKALPDLVPDKEGTFHSFLIDVKTTSGAFLGPWKKHVFNDRLDVQAAMYLDMYNAATGEERTTFGHIIQESFEPFEVVLRILSQEFLELGRMKYRRALAVYARCLETGEWPGFDEVSVFSLVEPRRIYGWTLVEPEPWMQG